MIYINQKVCSQRNIEKNDTFTSSLLWDSEKHKTLIGKLFQLIMIKLNAGKEASNKKKNQQLFLSTDNFLCLAELSIMLMVYHRVRTIKRYSHSLILILLIMTLYKHFKEFVNNLKDLY